jgi:hypothetical protein
VFAPSGLTASLLSQLPPHLRSSPAGLTAQLQRSCRDLLETRWETRSAEQQSLVQSACRSGFDSGDQAGALESVFGFEDEAVVLNLTLDLLEKPALRFLL